MNGVKVWIEPLQMFTPETGILWQVRSNVSELVDRNAVLQRDDAHSVREIAVSVAKRIGWD